MAEARWLLPPPGGPNNRTLAPLPSQASPATIAMTCAFESEGFQRLSRQELAFGEMSLDPAAVAFGEFMLGDCREEAGGGPAFLVGGLGKLRPQRLDRRQAQFVEEQAQPRSVDGRAFRTGDRVHAASPIRLSSRRVS